jgi:hypothetical protein
LVLGWLWAKSTRNYVKKEKQKKLKQNRVGDVLDQ